jgi:hypothetical protein
MKTQMTVLALAATTLVVLAGCNDAASPTATKTVAATTTDQTTPTATATTDEIPLAPATPSRTSSTPKSQQTTKTTKPASTAPKTGSGTKMASGPAIVSFKLVQKPKCAEGTAVFRAKAVPMIIEWKISGATGGALSVDDASHTPGTYGPVELNGTEEFGFTCAGPTGTVEKHTYAIYTVGGGKQRSKTITVKAKVLDKGLGADN